MNLTSIVNRGLFSVKQISFSRKIALISSFIGLGSIAATSYTGYRVVQYCSVPSIQVTENLMNLHEQKSWNYVSPDIKDQCTQHLDAVIEKNETDPEHIVAQDHCSSSRNYLMISLELGLVSFLVTSVAYSRYKENKTNKFTSYVIQ